MSPVLYQTRGSCTSLGHEGFRTCLRIVKIAFRDHRPLSRISPSVSACNISNPFINEP
ncbi:hypothetical protein BDW66DRAFT_145692 [Aspergillus desertorum]